MRLRRPSPTTIIAALALVFAIGGTAVAASRYVITSTSQIKPSVLRELRSDAARTAAVPKGPKAIIDRVSLTSPVALAEEPTEGLGRPAIPVTGGSWTQLAHQANEMFGQVTVSNPPQGACRESEGGATGVVEILLNDQSVGFVNPRSDSPWVPEGTYELDWSTLTSETESNNLWLADSANATSHVMTARGGDQCRDGSHFTVTAIHVDVLGFR